MNEWVDKEKMSLAEETRLWGECTFVFDSSALLNFYEYSPKSQENIFAVVFKQLEGRLWIPSHVQLEYMKNRKVTLKKPALQYKDLLDINFKQLKDLFNEIKNKTKTDEKHPSIDQSIFGGLESALSSFELAFKENIDEKIKIINSYESNDPVLKAFEEAFKIGQSYDYLQLNEIVREGEFRYKHKIPPGYMDGGVEWKTGFQVYGDLVIWKQIIDYAKEFKKSIVFINDDKKEDWWIRSKKQMNGPRIELVREIKDVAGVNFWMYTFSEFLERTIKILKTKLDSETINDVKEALVNTLQEPDWKGLLNRRDFIHLSGYQYAPCVHPDLNGIVSIVWDYMNYKLILAPIENPEIEIDLEKTFDLENYSYLLLNPHIPPLRWLYRIWIQEGKINLDLLFGPRMKVEIVDRQ